MEEDFVQIGAEKVVFYYRRKKIKNLNLKITKEAQIELSIPLKMPMADVKKFIKEKINWIIKHQKKCEEIYKKRKKIDFRDGGNLYLLGKKYEIKIAQGIKKEIEIGNNYLKIKVREKFVENLYYIKRFYEEWQKEYLKEILKDVIKKYEPILNKYKIKYPQIEIKKMKLKWGCCIPFKNKVIFNLHLIDTPIECVEYVVLHELTHFLYQKHDKKFYNFIEKYMPDWKKRYKLLNEDFSSVI